MMTDKTKDTEEATIACDICLKEIPKSVALSEEGQEQVYHFCGADCYEKWKAKSETKEKSG
jgi:hypothetical protein